MHLFRPTAVVMCPHVHGEGEGCPRRFVRILCFETTKKTLLQTDEMGIRRKRLALELHGKTRFELRGGFPHHEGSEPGCPPGGRNPPHGGSDNQRKTYTTISHTRRHTFPSPLPFRQPHTEAGASRSAAQKEIEIPYILRSMYISNVRLCRPTGHTPSPFFPPNATLSPPPRRSPTSCTQPRPPGGPPHRRPPPPPSLAAPLGSLRGRSPPHASSGLGTCPRPLPGHPPPLPPMLLPRRPRRLRPRLSPKPRTPSPSASWAATASASPRKSHPRRAPLRCPQNYPLPLFLPRLTPPRGRTQTRRSPTRARRRTTPCHRRQPATIDGDPQRRGAVRAARASRPHRRRRRYAHCRYWRR